MKKKKVKQYKREAPLKMKKKKKKFIYISRIWINLCERASDRLKSKLYIYSFQKVEDFYPNNNKLSTKKKKDKTQPQMLYFESIYNIYVRVQKS